MNDNEVKVKVTADTQDFEQKMKKTTSTTVSNAKKMQTSFNQLSSKLKACIPNMTRLQNSVKRLGNTFKGVGSSIKGFGSSIKGAIIGGLTSQIGQFMALQSVINGIKSSFSGYIKSLESATRFGYVFGSETKAMSQWLDELDSRVNMNRADVETFASTLYRMCGNLGLAKDEALDMTKSMTELSTDLQAFTGDANSVEALASALRGEYDSIQNYGVAISASTVEAKALAMGLDKASESSLMLARRAVLMEQCADIFGYAEGSAKTLSGQIGQLQENFRKLGNAIGSMFAPLLQAVLPTLNAIVSAVTKAFQKIADVVNQVFGIFGISVGGGGTGSSAVGTVVDGFNDVSDAIGGASSGAKGLADGLSDSVKSAKQLKAQMMGIDAINNLSSQSGGSGSGGSGSGGTGGTGGGVNGSMFGDANKTIQDGNKISDLAKRIAKIFEELVSAVKRFGEVASKWFKKVWDGGLKTLVSACGELLALLLELAMDGIGLVIDAFSTLLESPIGQWLAEVLGKGFELCGKAIQKLTDFVKENESWFKALAGILVGVVVGGFVTANGSIFAIIGVIGAVIGAIGLLYQNWDKITAFVKQCADNILNWIDSKFNGMKDLIIQSMKNAWDYIKLCWDNIKLTFNTIGDIIIAICQGDFGSIKTILSNYMTQIKENFRQAWEIIKNQFNVVLQAIKLIASTVWNGIKSTISSILDSIKTVCMNAWNSIKSTASSVWNSIKSTASSVWNSIKTAISNAINGAKNTVSSVINGIKSSCSSAWNSVKSTASSVWNGIKSTISNAINGAKNTVSSVVNGIKNSISSGFNSAKNTVSSVFNSMKNSISSVMNSAKNTVSSAVSKIKSFFNFSWSLPRPKIPKFTAKWSTVFGVKIPTGFNISWHKDGGIFTSPTLLGNHGVGEAGAEAILPLEKLWNELGKQFDKQTQQMAQNQTTTVIVQLDGKEVARSTVNNMKQMSQLGQLDTSWL